ncbi:WEB family protein at5g55860 [Phtheirospermum japonicum]|uniref:WEB family protein at5g55860 n=1 Tax=Phtheirospermum japonicum TaxID=374723 RepID=A0A830D3N6_9LAMI|nr:WEB family protein at5g55860 [Phtheirospermum japonicum]
MVAKDYYKTKGSAKAEVGEIDTSAPFQSVKDAVSLFGEGAFSGERPAIRKIKPHSAERVLAKETQLHLVEKELNKLKEQLQNAETTKAQALSELDRSKRAVEDLTQKLKTIHELKNSAIAATEASKHQAKQFAEANNSNFTTETDRSSNTDRAEYAAVVAELDAAKQDLRKIRQEYDAFIEIKNTATERADEAENSVKANIERAGELSKEIGVVKDSIRVTNLEITRAKDEEKLIRADKDEQRQSYKTRLDELEEKLLSNPKIGNNNLEARLAETLSEIDILRNEIEDIKSKDLESVNTVTLELDGAKGSLNKVFDEENSLRRLVETLKTELDEIKKEHFGLKEKEIETESTAGNLHVKLRKAKSDLEDAIAEEARARGASDEMVATIRQLASESRASRAEAEETKRKAEETKREAEIIKIKLEEAEKKLRVAVNEAEEAKEAEARALDRIQKLSEKTDAARASTSSEGGARIVISREEYDSLSRKVGESEKLAEMRIEAAMAQVEAVRASEKEAVRRLEGYEKEIEEMKSETKEALRKAEMAEAAKKAVEGELRRWREREEKKAAEVAARILAETAEKRAFEPSSSPIGEKTTRKLEKAKTTSVGKRGSLMPSLSGVFYKKKNVVDGGGSPSYLPGEKKSVW